MRVKICGITNLEDALAAIDAGADALGFIFYEKSRRFIAIEKALAIVEALPPFVQTVAVTVDATREFSNLGYRKQLKQFNVAQLHGHESPVHCRAVGKYLPVIKALAADQSLLFVIPEHMRETMRKLQRIEMQLEKKKGQIPTPDELAEETSLPVERVISVLRLAKKVGIEGLPDGFENIVAAFLLDTPSPEHGGTGRAFDWNLAVEFMKRTKKPVILSGGLNPENVAGAIEAVHPYAVDVSSGVESAPGRKDHAKLREFIRICKSF